jgi:protein TonB
MNSVAVPMPSPPVISHTDRLSLTVFVALALHALFILGISFNLVDEVPPESLTTIEITLVHNKSQDEPDDADYLAQANQLGGGDTAEKVRDSSPFSNSAPTQEKGIAPDSQRDLALPATTTKKDNVEYLTTEKSNQRVNSAQQKLPFPEIKKKPTAAQLFERSQEIARLSAKIQELKKSYAMTPRITYVHGVAAKEIYYASYVDAWRAKVERIGNLNYPEAALRKGINGSLYLIVDIDVDGNLKDVRILRSSGYKILDAAAKRIVHLAAPYPPLSKQIREKTDILRIPRVWHFKSSGLSTGAK